MTIKRYVREEKGVLYDRVRRRYIEVRSERQFGEYIHFNLEDRDEVVIHIDDIEERRKENDRERKTSSNQESL